jgi:hypothetical protein
MSEEPDQQRCPHCGVAYEPLQEYCLECGERLPAGPGTVAQLRSAWKQRFGRYPGDWIWPALLLLVVTVVATVAAAASASGSTTTVVATQPPIMVTLTATTTRTTVATQPKPPPTTTGKLPPAPGTTTIVRPAAPGLIAWPATGTAFTDVLESVPLASGRAAAVARARQAKAAGLPQAGVLVSAAFPSLHPGYYVVFSGVYPTSAGAVAGLTAAHSHGFPDAYVGRVTHP